VAPVGLPPALIATSGQQDAIYSAEDREVVPPTLVRPGPSALAPAEGPSLLFELLIAHSGRVEQVHQLSGERDLRASMLVASLKAWTFTPAIKDGHPVRYRLQVRLAV
jgi:hypothetical protein